MRSTRLRLATLFVAAAACGGGGRGNDDPRVIPGGGVGDGPIDGVVNVYVIDADTDAGIAGASVSVGDVELMTDSTGLAVFEGVEGPQTVAARSQGRRSIVWDRVNGANVTIPLDLLDPGTPAQATLSGTITGFAQITPAMNHVKAAAVVYTQTDDLGDPVNELQTPAMGNFCTTGDCPWTLVSRAGSLHAVALILDIDSMGTAPQDDDVITITGYAEAAVTVQDGVDQSGIELTMIEAGNLVDVTIDMGTPPAALTERGALVGIEISDDEVLQIPNLFASDPNRLLVPSLNAFPGSTYRLTAIAQTMAGDQDAQSILLRRGNTSQALSAGTWLVPPTGVTATRTSASWMPVAGALVHNVGFTDPTGRTILEITVFDNTVTSVTVPPLVALPTTGNLTARVGGIGATLDPQDFSLDADEDSLYAIAAEPVMIQ
jgi:hypothetical protein